MSGNLIDLIRKRAQNKKTINDMAKGISPTPIIHPVVDNSQITNAEQQFGFKLPQLLKDMYTQIGNGGYGPGYGIDELEIVLENYLDYMNDSSKSWQKGLIPILTWGACFESCIDCLSSDFPVYLTETIEQISDNDVFDDMDIDNMELYENEEENSIKIISKLQKSNFEKFMSDWAGGLNLLADMIGQEPENSDDEDYYSENEEVEDDEEDDNRDIVSGYDSDDTTNEYGFEDEDDNTERTNDW